MPFLQNQSQEVPLLEKNLTFQYVQIEKDELLEQLIFGAIH